MLIIHLKDLMIRKGALEGKRVTYNDIEKATGIKVSTLSKIANDQNYNISRIHIEKLCNYFGYTNDINKLMSIISENQ